MIREILESMEKDTTYFQLDTGLPFSTMYSDEPLEVCHKVTKREYARFEKGKEGTIEYISPDDYIDKCAEGFNKSRKEILLQRDEKVVDRLVKLLKKGTKLYMPFLDYVGGFDQEGLHRAMASKQLGIESIPVLVIKKADYTSDELADYRKKRGF